MPAEVPTGRFRPLVQTQKSDSPKRLKIVFKFLRKTNILVFKCTCLNVSHVSLPSSVSHVLLLWVCRQWTGQAAHNPLHELQDEDDRSEYTHEGETTLWGAKDFLCSS